MNKSWKLLTTMTTIMLGSSLGSINAAQGETKLRLSTYVNEADIRYQGFQHFADLIKEKTNGSVVIEIFPSGTLHGWSEGVDSVQGGVSDISWINADSRLPCYAVTSLYPTEISLEKQVELDAAYAKLIYNEAVSVNLVPLFNSNYSYDQEWWFDTPVEKIGDLDGKLVRSIGPLVSMMIETWGGQPVFVAPKEVFQSAERGVVDGINMGVATYSSWKLWNVMPHMINANLFYGNIQYMINKDKFDSLSANEQKALMTAASETETWLKPKYEAWVDQQVGNAVMQGGGSAVSVPKEQRKKLISSVKDKWDVEVDKSCGKELGDQIRDLFSDHAS